MAGIALRHLNPQELSKFLPFFGIFKASDMQRFWCMSVEEILNFYGVESIDVFIVLRKAYKLQCLFREILILYVFINLARMQKFEVVQFSPVNFTMTCARAYNIAPRVLDH